MPLYVMDITLQINYSFYMVYSSIIPANHGTGIIENKGDLQMIQHLSGESFVELRTAKYCIQVYLNQ